ncbi:hypothetical protein DL769_000771 [Monosporascus sp. CRB-8-3]|nr:hypothetical protein DL769_000771 [Monosporascus sp. CRB-8-3]
MTPQINNGVFRNNSPAGLDEYFRLLLICITKGETCHEFLTNVDSEAISSTVILAQPPSPPFCPEPGIVVEALLRNVSVLVLGGKITPYRPAMTAMKQLACGDRPLTACEFVQRIVLSQELLNSWHPYVLKTKFLYRLSARDAKPFVQRLSAAIQEMLRPQQEGTQKATGKGQVRQTAGSMPAANAAAGKKVVKVLRHVKFVDQHAAYESPAGFRYAPRYPVCGYRKLSADKSHTGDEESQSQTHRYSGTS